MRSLLPRALVSSLVLSSFTAFSLPTAVGAEAAKQSFKDVPPTHSAFEAVEYLKSKNIIGGFPDGAFRPGDPVTKAQATKIIIGSLVTAEQLAALKTTPYTDIPPSDWSVPYVEAARIAGVIDGPPKAQTFNGGRKVSKSEFLKILLLAQRENVSAHDDVKIPLANDVTNSADWYYPYFRTALVTSIDMVTPEGSLQPAKELTRADVCVILYRYLMYKEGRRTQALLSEAESEIVNVLQSLDKSDVVQAEYASARALLASRGAAVQRGNDSLVQAALKTSQSFRALVRAYRAGIQNDLDTVIKLAGEAWNLAGEAGRLHKDLESVTQQVQTIAKGMADSARQLKAKGPVPAPSSAPAR